MKRKAYLTKAMAVVLVLTGAVQAQTYLFDFDPNLTDIATGAVGVTDLSSPVNGVFGSDTITLTASAGNTTGNSRDRNANTGPYSDITRDFIQWPTASPITITISGLTADTEYEFVIWSGDLANSQIKTTDHTIAGASGGGTVRNTSVSLATENAAVGTSLHQVALPNVVSTAGGSLTYTIDYVSGGGGAATLNGMRITKYVVPEIPPTITNTTPSYVTDVTAGLAGNLDAQQTNVTVYAYWSTNDYDGQVAWEGGADVSWSSTPTVLSPTSRLWQMLRT